MMVMNMADCIWDAMAQKNTLVVRLGMNNSHRLYIAELVVAYILLALLIYFREIPVILGIMLYATLPVAVLQAKTVLSGHRNAPFFSSQYNGLCMFCGFVGSLLMNPDSLGLTGYFILWPLVPAVYTLSVLLVKKPWLRPWLEPNFESKFLDYKDE